jgi:HAD superfamily hydrolase (TIGR01549 family)
MEIKTLDKILNCVNLKNPKYIFLDFFDTLVYRDVPPEYIKILHSKKLKEYFGLKKTPNEIYQIRSNTENELYFDNSAAGLNKEFDLTQLFSSLHSKIVNYRQQKYLNKKEFVEKALLFELEIELSHIKLYKATYRVLDALVKNNKELFLVSDFYFPLELFKNILKDLDLLKYFNKVYISSDKKITKSTGDLYRYIIKTDSLDIKDIIMVGDNYYSDYQKPKELGVSSVWINRSVKKNNYLELEKRLFNKKDTLNQLYQKVLGVITRANYIYPELAAIYFYFIKQLLNVNIERNQRDVFFLSREGEFLKKLFEGYQIFLFGHVRIRAHYLKVSRKSTFIASLKKIEVEKFETLFRTYNNHSIKSFLTSLNFSDEVIDIIGNDMNVEVDLIFDNFKNKRIFKKLKSNRIFIKEYESLRTKQKELFIKYIDSFNVDYSEGLTIVDAGWKGTIQDHINRIIDRKVYGYYIGLIDPTNVSKNNMKRGLVFHNKPFFSLGYTWYTRFTYNTTLFELTLGASHGSAEYYSENKNGDVVVITSNREEEEIIYNKMVKPLQEKYYIDFFKIAKLFESTHYLIKDLSNVFIVLFSRIILLPKKEELNWFKEIKHYENFGIFNYSTFTGEFDFKNSFIKILKIISSPIRFLRTSRWLALDLSELHLSFLAKLFGRYKLLVINREYL